MASCVRATLSQHTETFANPMYRCPFQLPEAVAMLFLASIALPVFGQNSDQESGVDWDQFSDQVVVFLSGEARQTLTLRMQVVVQQIDAACSLSPSQHKRLQLAAKGAIDERLEGYERVLAQILTESKDAFVLKFRTEVEAYSQLGQDLIGPIERVTGLPRWQTFLQRTLDESQWKRYESDEGQAVIQACITISGRLSKHFILTRQQKDKISLLLAKRITEFTKHQVEDSADTNLDQIIKQLHESDAKEVEDTLNELQWKRWNKAVNR